jgi:asparagine synthase (glutamine-hydrolysing)
VSAIFAAVGGEPMSAAALQRAVVEMASRGAEKMDCRVGDAGGLAAGRFEWEAEATSAGPLVVDDGARVVVLDGSLYYCDALRRAIAGASVSRPFELGGDSPGHLLLGAYRAWGVDCARHLEGDFAFALWDRETQVLTCARDIFGTRPLFYGRNRARVIVASMASTVARHSEHGGALDLGAVGESLSGAFNLGEDTAYLGVVVVPVGHTLIVARGGEISLQAHWEPPAAGSVRASSFEEGAEELRALLTDAVDQRMAERGSTALWLSGGWDSTAILACGQRVLGRRASAREIAPVSMSYPEDDLGREDEAILSVAQRLGAEVTWCQSREVMLLPADPVTDAAQRDLPFAHAFEMWSRAMAARSRGVGARVVLTGTGGDELFAGTNLYLADLLRYGVWGSLALDWYRIRGRTLKGFRERVLHPALTARHGGTAEKPGPFEQRLMPWLREEFVRQHRLPERERAGAPYGRYPTLSATEQLWGITAPMFSRIRATLSSAQMRAGIVNRSPFLDLRLLRFALSRPRHERVTARETKRLLRRAMRGLLPDEFLAPRPRRTGITTQYMREQLQGPARPFLDAAFEHPVLAELGILDAARLQSDWRDYLRTGQGLALSFYDVYQTELWLRTHLGHGKQHSPHAETAGAVVS